VLQKKYTEALNVTRAGLKEQPDNFVLHLGLAGIFERTGDYENAISEYDKLLQKDPNSIVVANNLASLLADYRTDKASLDRAQALAAGLRKYPIPQFKDTLGWVSYRQGDHKAAIQFLEEAVQGLPNLAIVHYHLGMSFAAAAQPEKASEQFRTALTQAPDHDLEEKIRAAMAKISTQ
jgi:Tfp pilus assembly protein PilF